MEYDIQLKKKGILITKEWNSGTQNFEESEVETCDIPFFFHSPVCFERGLVSRDIAMFISGKERHLELILGCPYLNELINDCLKDNIISSKENDLVALEFNHMCNQHKGIFEHYVGFCGLGKEDIVPLDLVSFNDIADVPIILNEDFIIFNNRKRVIFNAKKQFTLLEILLSFTEHLSLYNVGDFFNLEEEVVAEIKSKVKFKKTNQKCINCQKNIINVSFDNINGFCEKCSKKSKGN
jgi:hypothetical protein